MYLLAAATDFECDCARRTLAERQDVAFLTTGVGPVETAFNLTSFLPLIPIKILMVHLKKSLLCVVWYLSHQHRLISADPIISLWFDYLWNPVDLILVYSLSTPNKYFGSM